MRHPADVSDSVGACDRARPAAEDRYQTAGQMWQPIARLWGNGRLSTATPGPLSAAPDGAPARATQTGRPRRARWGRILIVATVLVLVILLATRLWPGRRGQALRQASDASVAVLPLETGGGSVEDEYLSEGLSEEIIGRLAQVEGIKVISTTSTVALKGRRLTARQVADTLGVRHVLDGSLRRSGGQVQARMQLIDARRGVVVWHQTYTLGAGELLQLQDVIARQVTGALSHGRRSDADPAAPVRTTQAPRPYVPISRAPTGSSDARPRGSVGDGGLRAVNHPRSQLRAGAAGLASASTYGGDLRVTQRGHPYSELARSLAARRTPVPMTRGAAERGGSGRCAVDRVLYPDDRCAPTSSAPGICMPQLGPTSHAYCLGAVGAGRAISALAQARGRSPSIRYRRGCGTPWWPLAIGARRYTWPAWRSDTPGRSIRVSAFSNPTRSCLSGQANRCPSATWPLGGRSGDVPPPARPLPPRPPRSRTRSGVSSTRSATQFLNQYCGPGGLLRLGAAIRSAPSTG